MLGAVVYYVAAICCCCKANTRHLIPVSATPCRLLILARGVGSCSRTQPQQRDSWHRRRHRQIPERSPDRNTSITYMSTHALSFTYQSSSTRYRPPSLRRYINAVLLLLLLLPARTVVYVLSSTHRYRCVVTDTVTRIAQRNSHTITTYRHPRGYYSQTGNGSQQKISKTRNVGQCLT